jgi:DNA-binding transcriptional regulator YiaG
MVTCDQIRAARSLLGLSQPEVAAAAGVSSMTVKRAEGRGKPAATVNAMKAVQAALEAAGVEFTNGDQPGVRLRKV